MKKTFTCTLALALALSAAAEQLKVLSLGPGQAGVDQPQLLGLGISPDGRYVCGPIDFGEGFFVMDVDSGEGKYDYMEDSELYNVDLNGLAIGAYGYMGCEYSLGGEISELKAPDGYKYILGQDISNDGSIKVGSIVAPLATYAAYSVRGGEWTMLPMPPADMLGDYTNGSSAIGVSGDGKYIIGHAGNFGPVMLWTRCDDGSYEPDAIFARFCSLDGPESDEKPLVNLLPRAISNNGLHVLCAAVKIVVNEDGEKVHHRFPAVYGTETGQLKLYDEFQEIDELEMGLTGNAIANDGTFVGMIGPIAFLECAGSFIMGPDDTQARLLMDVFPEYYEKLDYPDYMGWSIPTDISADGSRILGYAYYSDDFLDNSPAYYMTYIIDTKSQDNSVEWIGTTSDSDEIYSLDGVRIKEMKRGVNIVRSADGSVRKILKQ